MTNVSDASELIELSNHLARHRPHLAPELRPHVSKLAEQIKNFPHNPDGLRPLIASTLERITELGSYQ